MLIITVDVDKALRTLENMQFQLKSFPSKMKDEMLAWQADDMHRKRPRARYSLHRRRVSTKIYPRGRHHYKQKVRNYPLRRRRGHRRHWSTRPILRPALYAELHERMVKIFTEIGWASE